MWYYKDGDKEIGPVNKDELRQLLKDRKIGARTLLRSVKGKQWQSLGEMVKKKPPKVPTSPPPPEEPTVEGKDSPPPGSSNTLKPPKEPTSPPASKEPAINEKDAPLPDTSSTLKPSKVTKHERLSFKFTGSGGEYFKIWIVNIILSVLTLGIYSAWAKVRRKQYFYGNTEVSGASFNYLANPVTILKGRIIVFLGFMIYSLVNQFYPIAGVALLLLFMPLLPWFVVRALSFNARNSAIRNIRFTFHSTYFEAAKVFLFLPLLLPLTLGLIFPYLLYRQKKFLVDNSTYGTAKFDFKATPKDYYMLFVGLLVPIIICGVASGVVGFFVPFAAVLFLMVFYLYVMAYITVKSTNLLYNSSNLSDHEFQSTMGIKDYVVIVVTNTLATVLTIGLFHPFAQVRAYRYQIEHLDLMAVGDLDQFVAAEQKQISALGDEAAEFLDFDFGI